MNQVSTFEAAEALIRSRLTGLRPYRAFLFGSAAWGIPDESSDIDLLVILDQPGLPGSFDEKMENHRIVRRLLRDINAEIPLDIIVFTRGEWDQFISTGSSFSREITGKGKRIA